MKLAHSPGVGLRKYDEQTAIAEQHAARFQGLSEDEHPGSILAALKRAAPYIGLPRTCVAAMDSLFAWSLPIDWRVGSSPCVWPSTETLARKWQVSVRQVQYILRRLVSFGLITHRDSPNGNRYGVRGPDKRIVRAYGIVLSPTGARWKEFEAAAAAGEAADARMADLRRQLSSKYRRVRELCQALADQGLVSTEAEETLAFAEMTSNRFRRGRDETQLRRAVSDSAEKVQALEAVVADLLNVAAVNECTALTPDSSPSHEQSFASKTTTIELRDSFSSGLAIESSDDRHLLPGQSRPSTTVEEDLSRHGVDPAFISSVLPTLAERFTLERTGWLEIRSAAEDIVRAGRIPNHAMYGAIRVMGSRGAAAAILACDYKHQIGHVRKPGAYLQELTRRAASGELHLAKTYHGFKDNAHSTEMAAMNEGTMPRAIGALLGFLDRQQPGPHRARKTLMG